MSKSSLTRIARELIDLGLVAEAEAELRFGTGRPSERLRVVPRNRHFAGFKLTGDAAYAAVTDLQGTVVETTSARLESQDPAAVVAQVGAILSELTERWPNVSALGVTLAGAVREVAGDQLVVQSEFLGWNELPLVRMLAGVADIPVSVENDVQALTAAEHWFGAGAGLENMAVITVGAGIGCGLIANGELIAGSRGMAGQVGHLMIEPLGPLCRHGHRGCVDAYLTNDSISRSMALAVGHPVPYEEAVELASAGDPVALRIFDEAGYALGRAIAVVANLHDPEKVIVTGEGLGVWSVAEAGIRRGIAETFSGNVDSLAVEAVAFEFDEWARAAAVLAIRTAVRTGQMTIPVSRAASEGVA